MLSLNRPYSKISWVFFTLMIAGCFLRLSAQEIINLTSSGQNGVSGTWTNTTGVPQQIRITAQGGGGGKGYYFFDGGIIRNGSTGATLQGEFVVQPGQTLFAIAGGKGGDYLSSESLAGGGGGAGSGVVNLSTGTLLLLAAGGTGAYHRGPGLGGSAATNGDGSGGGNGAGLATGGGGLLGDGQGGTANECPAVGGGQVKLDAISQGAPACGSWFGGAGGSGMGGGGSASDLAGGGGGHTGGSGGSPEYGPYTSATSYNIGTDQMNTDGSNNTTANDGTVIVEIMCNVTLSAVVTVASCTTGGRIVVTPSGSAAPVTYSISPNAGTQNPAGTFNDLPVNTYTITVQDANNCTAMVTRTVTSSPDTQNPAITCPVPITVSNTPGQCGATVNFSASATDNCAIASVAYSKNPGTLFTVGTTTVTATATDNTGNTANCTFSVTVNDTQLPTFTSCSGGTLAFDGQETLPVTNAVTAAATDNCPGVTLSYSPATIACTQVGQTVPVTVTATDGAGNTTNCIANVYVDGLPCGFTAYPGHIDCPGSNATYNAASETFQLISNGCTYGAPYAADDMAYVKTSLCGNGEIIAKVDNMAGGLGWAGIVMREGPAPGAKKIQLSWNGSNFARREVRTQTGGQAYPQQFFSLGKSWLRIARSGNQFSGYISADGVNWQLVMAAIISMPQCIEAGLILTNYYPANVITATFSHVSVTEPAQRPTITTQFSIQDPARDADDMAFTAYPNPTTGRLTLQSLKPLANDDIYLEVVDRFGRQVISRQLAPEGQLQQEIDLSDQAAGVYLIRLRQRDGGEYVQRIVLQPQP